MEMEHQAGKRKKKVVFVCVRSGLLGQITEE